jgi:hypothetical protein
MFNAQFTTIFKGELIAVHRLYVGIISPLPFAKGRGLRRGFLLGVIISKTTLTLTLSLGKGEATDAGRLGDRCPLVVTRVRRGEKEEFGKKSKRRSTSKSKIER